MGGGEARGAKGAWGGDGWLQTWFNTRPNLFTPVLHHASDLAALEVRKPPGTAVAGVAVGACGRRRRRAPKQGKSSGLLLPAAVGSGPEVGEATQPIGVLLAAVLPDGVGAAIRLAAGWMPAGELRGAVPQGRAYT